MRRFVQHVASSVSLFALGRGFNHGITTRRILTQPNKIQVSTKLKLATLGKEEKNTQAEIRVLILVVAPGPGQGFFLNGFAAQSPSSYAELVELKNTLLVIKCRFLRHPVEILNRAYRVYRRNTLHVFDRYLDLNST